MALFFLALTAIISIRRFVLAQTCHFPDGSEANSYQPCGPNEAQCCYNIGPEWTDGCFSNGFCWSWITGSFYRGACTDKDWSATSGCATLCTDTHEDDVTYLSRCDDGNICCGTVEEAADCCANGEGGSWMNATITNFEIVAVDGDSGGGSLVSSFPTSDAQPSRTSSALRTSSNTGSPPTTSAITSPVENGNSGNAQGNRIDLGVGLGIGIPSFLVALAALWYTRKHLKRDGNAKVESPQPTPSNTNNTSPQTPSNPFEDHELERISTPPVHTRPPE